MEKIPPLILKEKNFLHDYILNQLLIPKLK